MVVLQCEREQQDRHECHSHSSMLQGRGLQWNVERVSQHNLQRESSDALMRWATMFFFHSTAGCRCISDGALPPTRHPSFAATRWRWAPMYRSKIRAPASAISVASLGLLATLRTPYGSSSAARLRHFSASAGFGRTPCTPWRASTFASNVSASLMAAGAKPRSAARAKYSRAVATFPLANWRSPCPTRRSACARAAGSAAALDGTEGAGEGDEGSTASRAGGLVAFVSSACAASGAGSMAATTTVAVEGGSSLPDGAWLAVVCSL